MLTIREATDADWPTLWTMFRQVASAGDAFVVSVNAAALRVWEKRGFAVVGRMPRAFRNQALGLVDVLILHREL